MIAHPSAREMVARIIDPESFRLGSPDYYGPNFAAAWASARQRVALGKADQVLAAIVRAEDRDGPHEPCNCRIGDCVRLSAKCREMAGPT